MISRTTFKSNFSSQQGFTLVELLMVIAIIGVLAAISLIPITNSIDDARFQETVQKMESIRNAMIGDPTIKENGVRTSFGFLGDVGAIPTGVQGIAALVTNPGITAWNIHATERFGTGWNGPYLTSAQAGTVFTKDSWGRDFVYNAAATPPTIVSYGADGVAGGTGLNSDITVELPTTMQTATVYGFVSVAAKPFVGDADVEINYPDGSGGITSSLVTIAAVDKGKFSFNNIPLGKRSITVYIPNKASPTQTIGPALITVDSGNYVIPSTTLDTNSAGASSCNNLGIIALNGAASTSGGGTVLNFNINVSNNIVLQQVSITNSTSTTWNQIVVNGTTFTCSGANSLYVCPVADNGTLSTMTPSLLVNSGSGLAVAVTLATSIAGSGTATVQFNYNLGCDQLSLTGL